MNTPHPSRSRYPAQWLFQPVPGAEALLQLAFQLQRVPCAKSHIGGAVITLTDRYVILDRNGQILDFAGSRTSTPQTFSTAMEAQAEAKARCSHRHIHKGEPCWFTVGTYRAGRGVVLETRRAA